MPSSSSSSDAGFRPLAAAKPEPRQRSPARSRRGSTGASSSASSSLDIFNGFQPIELLPTEGAVHVDEEARTLTLAQCVAVVVGMMIGSSIFVAASPIYVYTQSVGLSLLVWMLAGALSMAGALCYAELGALLPGNGGEFAYLLEAYGPMPSMAFMWTNMTLLRTGGSGILAATCARYARRLVTDTLAADPGMGEHALAAAFFTLAVLLNGISPQLAARMQSWFMAAKLLAVGTICMAGLVVYIRGNGMGPAVRELPPPTGPVPEVSVTSIVMALQAALWGYDGWNNLNYVSGQVQDPEKRIPLALVIAVVLVAAVYLVTNWAYFVVLPHGSLLVDTGMATEFGLLAFGSAGRVLIPVFIILSAFGALMSGLYSGTYLITTAAAQSSLAAWFPENDPRGVWRALGLQWALALPMVLSAHVVQLIHWCSFAAYVFYGTTAVALVVLRVSAKWRYVPRPYRVWWSTPALFVGVCVWMVGVSVAADALHATWLFLWVAFGVLLWALGRAWQQQQLRREGYAEVHALGPLGPLAASPIQAAKA